MATKGLAAVVKIPGKIELEEFSLPKIGAEDGLLKVAMVALSLRKHLRIFGEPMENICI